MAKILERGEVKLSRAGTSARLAMTALLGLAPVRSARALPPTTGKASAARQLDDLGVAKSKVTIAVTGYACPQHSCVPRGRACGERKSPRKQSTVACTALESANIREPVP
jgi:hypothetical protein